MHKHAWPYEDPSTYKCTEIGPDVCIRPTVHGDDQHLAGFILAHEVDWNDGDRSEGYVNVDPDADGKPIWSVTGSLEGGDLTLSPSILHHGDPHPDIHGYVRNGKWVPA